MKINNREFVNSASGIKEAVQYVRAFVPIYHERGFNVKKFESRTDAENFIHGIKDAFVMGGNATIVEMQMQHINK